jgi:hypothetical protein
VDAGSIPAASTIFFSTRRAPAAGAPVGIIYTRARMDSRIVTLAQQRGRRPERPGRPG